MRYDFGINDALKVTEKATNMTVGNCDEVVLIVESFPEIDYVLAYRGGGSYEPWVAAWGYNGINSWSQGHYFEKLETAMEYIRMKQGKPNWYRMDEIASKAIDKLIEDDPYEAEEFLSNEIEITDEEAEYFCIADNMDMTKGYEEEDENDEGWL